MASTNRFLQGIQLPWLALLVLVAAAQASVLGPAAAWNAHGHSLLGWAAAPAIAVIAISSFVSLVEIAVVAIMLLLLPIAWLWERLLSYRPMKFLLFFGMAVVIAGFVWKTTVDAVSEEFSEVGNAATADSPDTGIGERQVTLKPSSGPAASQSFWKWLGENKLVSGIFLVVFFPLMKHLWSDFLKREHSRPRERRTAVLFGPDGTVVRRFEID